MKHQLQEVPFLCEHSHHKHWLCPSTLSAIEALYANLPNAQVSKIDGLSIAFPDWRFNLRGSNTEPVLRLNVESNGNPALMAEKTDELLRHIRA